MSGPYHIDIDVSATKLLLFTSFSHSPPRLCWDYGLCHHSPTATTTTTTTTTTSKPATTSFVMQPHNKCREVDLEAEINSLKGFFSSTNFTGGDEWHFLQHHTQLPLLIWKRSVSPHVLQTNSSLIDFQWLRAPRLSLLISGYWTAAKTVKRASLLWLIWVLSFWQHLITKPGANAAQRGRRGKTARPRHLAVNILHTEAHRGKE